MVNGERTVWCILGIDFLGAIPDPPMPKRERKITLVADADAKGSEGYRDRVLGIDDLQHRGIDVFLAVPEGTDGRDANDVLQEQGAEAVRKLISSRSYVGKGGSEAKMIRRKNKPAARPTTDDPATGGRPTIQWSEADYPRIMREVEAILIEAKVGLYQIGGRLMHMYRYDRDDRKEDDVVIRRKAGSGLSSRGRIALIARDWVSYASLEQLRSATQRPPFL